MYFALNYGYDLITRQGNLEGGIYHLTSPNAGPWITQPSVFVGARICYGASFWVDWEQALNYFQLSAGFLVVDGTMTASQRFFIAPCATGMNYFCEEYCAAYDNWPQPWAHKIASATNSTRLLHNAAADWGDRDRVLQLLQRSSANRTAN
jgi:hypothetical protein